MIPKTIHYCWFGRGKKPKLAQKSISSWKKFCQGFEIVEWNEDNFDVAQNQYLKNCYERKAWAFLSDYARLLVLEKHGGIYLDTDVEIVRPIDDLLEFDAFFGFETNERVNTGQGFGAIPNHPAVKAMTKIYQGLFPDANGNFLDVSCPGLNTQALLPYGLRLDGSRQTVLGAEILPSDFFCPYDDQTGKLNVTDNTYGIHWYGKSWFRKRDVLRNKLTRPLHRLFGTDFFLFKLVRKMRKQK